MLLASLHQAADLLGQDAPEPEEAEDCLLTVDPKASLSEELNIGMAEIERGEQPHTVGRRWHTSFFAF